MHAGIGDHCTDSGEGDEFKVGVIETTKLECLVALSRILHHIKHEWLRPKVGLHKSFSVELALRIYNWEYILP